MGTAIDRPLPDDLSKQSYEATKHCALSFSVELPRRVSSLPLPRYPVVSSNTRRTALFCIFSPTLRPSQSWAQRPSPASGINFPALPTVSPGSPFWYPYHPCIRSKRPGHPSCSSVLALRIPAHRGASCRRRSLAVGLETHNEGRGVSLLVYISATPRTACWHSPHIRILESCFGLGRYSSMASLVMKPFPPCHPSGGLPRK